MKKIAIAGALITMMFGCDAGPRSTSSTPAATAPATLGALADSACKSELTTEEAASCSAGGWSYVGCCAIGKSRWKKGSSYKCCGACMTP